MVLLGRFADDFYDLYIFTSDTDESSFVLRRSDLPWITGLFLIGALAGFACAVWYLAQDSADIATMADGVRWVWVCAPALCGNAVYYVRTIYRLGSCFERKRVDPSANRDYDGALVHRRCSLIFFLSRFVLVPIAAFFFVLLLRCGLLSAFVVAPGAEGQGDLAFMGVAFLLGISGGRMLGYLMHTGRSALTGGGV